MVLYWVFPAVLASLLFAFLRRSREFKVNAAIVCVSVAVSVYAVELTLAFSSFGFPTFRDLLGRWCFHAHRKRLLPWQKSPGLILMFARNLKSLGICGSGASVPCQRLFPWGYSCNSRTAVLNPEIAVDGAEVLPLSGISNRVTVLCNESGKYAIYDSDQRGFHNPKTEYGNRVT